jgi:YidC/Oxa1 family membrane protein insertase
MDKNSIIGLVLIAGIVFGWSFFLKPSQEELAKRQQQFQLDSIAHYNELEKTKTIATTKSITSSSQNGLADSSGTPNDSLINIFKKKVYGDFVEASTGEYKIITIENELMKVNVSTKGGRIASVELKKYKTYDGKPLLLFTADSSIQNIKFNAYSKAFTTDSLYFTPEGSAFILSGDKSSKSLAMRLYAGSKTKYIEYVYTLTGNEYMMACRINTVGMQDIINTGDLTLNWQMKTPKQ